MYGLIIGDADTIQAYYYETGDPKDEGRDERYDEWEQSVNRLLSLEQRLLAMEASMK